MARPVPWRVRVTSRIESWVELLAHTAAEAEIEAGKLPSVLSVFAKSAIRADDSAVPERPAGVQEDQ